MQPKVYEGMNCSYCLFCHNNGPSVWCDYKEEYTGRHSPVCDNFIPDAGALDVYKKKFGREGQ